MQLILNETDAENVRRETLRGREYLVTPVVPIRAMNLDGGYVPEAHVQKSAPAWNGTPVTLNHPRDANGHLVSANSPDVVAKTWLGHLFNNQVIEPGDRTRGELWLDVAHANEIGGEAEQVVEAAEAGDPLAVSTSYFADPLEPGEYDGAHRDEVAGNLRPDHLAVLPNADGRCSIDDGCVAGPQAVAANVDGDVAASDLRVASVPDDADDPTLGEGSRADTDMTRLENVLQKFGFSKDMDATDGAESATNGDASPAADGGSADGQSGNEPAESGAATDADADANDADADADSTPDMNRDNMIDVLVNEHGFTRDSLDGMGDSCLEQTFESFNDEDGDDSTDTDDDAGAAGADTSDDQGTAADGGQPDDDTAGGDDTDADFSAVMAELETMQDQMVTADDVGSVVEDQMAANKEQTQRDRIIGDILDATDEWEEDELRAVNSTSALEKIAADVTDTPSPGANFAAQRGATATPASDDDVEKWESLVARANGTETGAEGDD